MMFLSVGEQGCKEPSTTLFSHILLLSYHEVGLPKELGGNGIRTADLNRPEEYSISYGIFHILGRKVLQAMGVLSAAALGVSWASVVGW